MVYDPTGAKESWPISLAQLKSELGAGNRLAIYNANGIATFYPDFQNVAIDVQDGDTVYVFADIPDATIFLTTNMTIISSGHTFPGIIITGAFDCKIWGANIIANGVGESIVTGPAGSVLDLLGSTVRNNLGPTLNITATAVVENGTSIGLQVINTGTLTNHKATGDSAAPSILNTGVLENCIGINTSNGIGISQTAGSMVGCIGKAVSNSGIFANAGTLSLCNASNTGALPALDARVGATATLCNGTGVSGIGSVLKNAFLCTGTSNGSVGLVLSGGHGCKGSSVLSYGVQLEGAGSVVSDITGISASNSACNVTASDIEALDCTWISEWDNASGHAVRVANDTKLVGNTFKTTNAAAYALYSGSAVDARVSHAKYLTTLALSPLVTQVETRTADLQGNTILN